MMPRRVGVSIKTVSNAVDEPHAAFDRRDHV